MRRAVSRSIEVPDASANVQRLPRGDGRLVHLAADEVVVPDARERGIALVVAFKTPRKIVRSHARIADVAGTGSVHRHEHGRDRVLQIELTLEPARVLRQPRHAFDRVLEMRRGLVPGRPFDRALPCGLPEHDRLLVVAGGRQVLRDQLGLLVGDLGKPLLQRCRDASMEELPVRPQQ